MTGFRSQTDDLKSVGKNNFGWIYQDLSQSETKTDQATLDVSIFGEGDEAGPQIVQTYNDVKSKIKGRVTETKGQVGNVGNALARIAQHYEDLDKGMS